MTIDDGRFHENLKISRNKVEMLLKYHLDSVADAIISRNDPVLPFPTRGGILDFSKNPQKFGIIIYVNISCTMSV